MKNSNDIFFSIILPLADNANPKTLDKALKSLFKQTFRKNEVLLILSKNLSREFSSVLDKYPQTIQIVKQLSKSKARNYAANFSKGNYLVHLDIDNILDRKTLSKTAEIIEKKQAKAIILHERTSPKGLLSAIRSLERKVNFQNNELVSPQVVEKKTFLKIGGFDEEIDILDEWSLHLKLKRAGVSFFEIYPIVEVVENHSLIRILKRKYLRGRFLPLLKEKYPEFNHINLYKRFSFFLKQNRLLREDPLAAVGLFVLKPTEWFFLFLGSLNPIKPKNYYSRKKVSENYDQSRTSTNQKRYKNFTEEAALDLLLKKKGSEILEIGSGTGRITTILQNKGFKVTPTEPSEEMVKIYQENPKLPKIFLFAGEKVSKKLGYFDHTLGLRVVWHIKNKETQEKIILKASKVSSGSVIFDFATWERFRNPLLYPFFCLYSLFFNRKFFSNDYFFKKTEIEILAKKSDLQIDKKIPLDLLFPIWLNLIPRKTAEKTFPFLFKSELWLSKFIPPGRWLIRFEKSI